MFVVEYFLVITCHDIYNMTRRDDTKYKSARGVRGMAIKVNAKLLPICCDDYFMRVQNIIITTEPYMIL